MLKSVVLGIVLIVSCQVARADSLQAIIIVDSFGAGCGGAFGPFGCFSNSNSAATGPVTNALPAGWAFGQGQPTTTFHGLANASASATYDVLRTYADETLTMDTNGTRSAETLAQANMGQILQADGFPGNGFLRFTATLDGVINGVGKGILALNATSIYSSAEPSCMVTLTSSGFGICSKLVKVDNVSDIHLELSLISDVNISVTQSGGAPGTTTTVSGTSNFLSSARISSVQAFDANMNPITGVTLRSESGFTYAVGSDPTGVPEPASLLTLATALSSLAFGVIWKRSKGKNEIRYPDSAGG